MEGSLSEPIFCDTSCILIYIYTHIYIYIYNTKFPRERLGALRFLRFFGSSKTLYCRTKRSNSLLGPLGAACALEYAARARSEPPLALANAARAASEPPIALENLASARPEPPAAIEVPPVPSNSLLQLARRRQNTLENAVRAVKMRSATPFGLPRSRRLPSKTLLALAQNHRPPN